MKVAFIVDKFPSLSETFILNQIVGLIDRGCMVDVYASQSGTDPVVHADVQKYNLLDHTYYYGHIYTDMPKKKLVRLIRVVNALVSNTDGRFSPLLRSLNILKYKKRAASFSLFYQTNAFLNRQSQEYDIVHGHFGPNGCLAALLKDVGAVKGKVITSFYGYDVSQFVRDNGTQIYDHLFKVGDLFLPLSERMKQQLIELGCHQEKIRVQRLGVDLRKFPFLPRGLNGNSTIQLLTISRLVEKKGVSYGIQAVAKVLDKYPHIEYKIAGDGPMKPELQNLIDDLNVGDHVKLLGWKQQEEIVSLVKSAHILLAPSVTSQNGDEEGTPVALMEALAQGLPVVSTQHSGIPEVVTAGKSGFLVPERDVDTLTEKIISLIEHPEYWPEMGQAGRRHIETHYNIDKLVNNQIELYQQLLTIKD